MKNWIILPLKPYMPTNKSYQGQNTTFGILSVLILQKKIDGEDNTLKMLSWKPLKIKEIDFYGFFL